MKKIIGAVLVMVFAVSLQAAELTFEGTYTTSYKSSTEKTFKGTLISKSDTEYEGEIIAPWNGKNEVYKGVIKKAADGSFSGDFLLKSKRRFTFTVKASGGSYTGDALEKGKKVGLLQAKISEGKSTKKP